MEQIIYEQFKQSVIRFRDSEALAVVKNGRYQPITYRKLDEQVNYLAAALSRTVKAGDKIALMLDNSPAWVVADLAGAKLGLVIVPIHTTYHERYISYIVKHSGSTILFINEAYFQKYKDCIQGLGLRKIILVETPSEESYDSSVSTFNTLIKEGEGLEGIQPCASKTDSVHTIVYTSGTTGEPKGVMLSHRNIISNAFAAMTHVSITKTDRFFSFLPLSHIFERTVGYYIPLFAGAAIYYARGRDTLLEDIKQAKPTVFICVPRIFERVYEGILDKIKKSKVKEKLFFAAMKCKRDSMKADANINTKFKSFIFNWLVLKKIRGLFGGRLRFVVSGSACLSKHIARFFETIGILILEGYGLTETSPVVTENWIERYRFGTVGLPVHGVSVKISNDKEILVKGENVMRGYYNDDKGTQEAFTSDGWFTTGDLGFLDNDGFLTIIGRKKELIILSTGKNIAPVPIEEALEETPYIMQAMVYGDKMKHTSALIVPEFDKLKAWCKEQNMPFKLPDVLRDQKVIDFYKEIISNALKHFSHIEQVARFTLLEKPFTQEDDLLTPTLKLRRENIIHRFLLIRVK